MASPSEFALVVAYLSAGSGKQLSEQQAEVYFDLLGDLPAEVLLLAAKQAILQNTYPTLPTVGALRKNATDALAGVSREPTPDEAWGMVRFAISSYGYMREEEALASLPSGPVRRATECLGWQSMCESEEPEICRAQFRKAYEGLSGKEQRHRLLPMPIAAQIEALAGTFPMPKALGYDRRNAWQVIQDEAAKRRRIEHQKA